MPNTHQSRSRSRPQSRTQPVNFIVRTLDDARSIDLPDDPGWVYIRGARRQLPPGYQTAAQLIGYQLYTETNNPYQLLALLLPGSAPISRAVSRGSNNLSAPNSAPMSRNPSGQRQFLDPNHYASGQGGWGQLSPIVSGGTTYYPGSAYVPWHSMNHGALGQHAQYGQGQPLDAVSESSSDDWTDDDKYISSKRGKAPSYYRKRKERR